MADRHDLLIEQLTSPDPTTRRYAAEDLGDLHDACVVPALVEAVRDPEVAVREAALEALVVVGGPAVCENVAPLLETGDVALRNYAVEVLERVGPESIDVLIAACKSASPDVRKFAVEILGKVARGRAGKCLDAVAALLGDDNQTSRDPPRKPWATWVVAGQLRVWRIILAVRPGCSCVSSPRFRKSAGRLPCKLSVRLRSASYRLTPSTSTILQSRSPRRR